MTTIEYGYVSARIRAMKGSLLDGAFFDRLLSMATVAEVVVALEKTAYKKEVHEAVLRVPGAEGIENGLRDAVVNSFTLLRNIVDGRVSRLVDVLLGRWDVQNLKTVIRGLHIGETQAQIMESVVPAGAISYTVLKELARQGSVRACLDLMATWSMPEARPLTECYFDYTREMRTQGLEFALDRFYFDRSLSRLSDRSLDAGIVREVIKREIDVTNIMTLLRLVQERAAPERKLELFLPGGGQIDEKLFREMAEKEDLDDIVMGLSATYFGKALKTGWEAFLVSGRFSLIERYLERHLVLANISLFRAEPLSVAVIVAYIWAKLNEVTNLRIIVRGKVVGMPEDKVRQSLVLV